MFFQILDYFVGENFKQNLDQFYKVRLLVGILLTFMFSVGISIPFYMLIPGLPEEAIYWTYIIALLTLSVWGMLVYLIKKGKAYEVSAHGAVFSLLFVLFAGIAVTGGPEKTEVQIFLVLAVIAAFLLLGQRAGILWAVIVLVIYAFMAFAAYNNVEFLDTMLDEYRVHLRIFNWLYSFLVITVMVWLYESIACRIMGERDAERGKFKSIAKAAVDSSVVTDSADKLANTGESLLDAVIQQKTSIEQLSATTEELGATAEQNAQLTQSAKSSILATEEHLLIAKADILQLVESMNEMSQSSYEIQTINNLINDISYQTNILSLNAMIEASRFSDGGGGFKVVALEVKSLAERSANAAESINKLLDRNKVSAEQGLSLTDTMKRRFEEISEKIQPLSHAIHNVSEASYEQSEAIRQITDGLHHIDKAIANSEVLAKQSATTAQELRQSASGLLSMVQNVGVDLE